MNFQEIPIIAPPNESVDNEQVEEFAATIVDAIPVIVDGRRQLVKRPGLVPFLNLNTSASVDGLFWSDAYRAVVAVSAANVYKITDPAGTMAPIPGSSGLIPSAPVRFAGGSTLIAMANGSKTALTNLSTVAPHPSVNTPANVTHVAAIDGYLLQAKVGTAQIYFSDPLDWNTIGASDFFSAESKFDNVTAIAEGFNEIIVLGDSSVEFFTNDGQTPFSRIPGSAQPFGVSAAQSLALTGSTWMWLDHQRRFATMEGRRVVNVSTPYDRLIQRFQSVNDAVGYVTSIDGMPIYVLNFPTDRQTLAYNYETKEWHKWGYWDSSNGVYRRYRGLSYCFAKDWNLHLFGDYANGMIYKATRSAFTDAGNPIRSMIRTGNLSHGSMGTKRSDCIRLRCKRGAGNANVTDPQISLRRRIDGNGYWTNERFRSLGKTGQHSMFLDWRANGIYMTQQLEFTHSDNSDFVIMGAQESVTPLLR